MKKIKVTISTIMLVLFVLGLITLGAQIYVVNKDNVYKQELTKAYQDGGWSE